MNDRRNEEMEIDLLELFFYLIKRWKQLLLGLIVGGLLAGGFTVLKTPVYQSESMLYILSKTTSITSVADLQLGNALSSDFVVIATSKPVLDTAIEKVEDSMGVELTRKEVLEMINVTNKDDTRVLVITGTSEDPKLACELTNAVTEATASQMADIMKSDPPTTVERAEVEDEPVDKGLKKNAGIGAIVGLLIVAILYIIPFLLNDRIKTPEDVEKYLESGVLGSIPLDKAQEFQDKKRQKKQKKQKGNEA